MSIIFDATDGEGKGAKTTSRISDKEIPDWLLKWIPVPKQIRSLREVLGITQKQLAERTHVKQSAIAQVENNNRGDLRLSTIEKIAHALECEVILRLVPRTESGKAEDQEAEKKAGQASKEQDVPFSSLTSPIAQQQVLPPAETGNRAAPPEGAHPSLGGVVKGSSRQRRDDLLKDTANLGIRTPEPISKSLPRQKVQHAVKQDVHAQQEIRQSAVIPSDPLGYLACEPIPGTRPQIGEGGLIPKDITTESELSRAEWENIQSAVEKYIRRKPTAAEARFDYAWLLELHQEMFGRVWSWAGRLRQADLKGVGVPYSRIGTELCLLLVDYHMLVVGSELGIGKMVDPMEVAAKLHHRLVRIHPFLGGNVRWARMVVDIYLRKNGLPLMRWPDDSQVESSGFQDQYLEALYAADQGNYDPMIRLHRSHWSGLATS